jgi:POT family proton-dependent oligopeptide transporter
MQGGWFAATAIGNSLVGVTAFFWERLPLSAVWGILVAACLLSAGFIFAVMKRLERAASA